MIIYQNDNSISIADVKNIRNDSINTESTGLIMSYDTHNNNCIHDRTFCERNFNLMSNI